VSADSYCLKKAWSFGEETANELAYVNHTIERCWVSRKKAIYFWSIFLSCGLLNTVYWGSLFLVQISLFSTATPGGACPPSNFVFLIKIKKKKKQNPLLTSWRWLLSAEDYSTYIINIRVLARISRSYVWSSSERARASGFACGPVVSCFPIRKTDCWRSIR